MSMAVETQLVDFNALEQDPSVERRGALMKQVVSLFALTADRCSDDLLHIYDSVLLRLADMVEQEAKRFASEKLADLQNAPRDFVCALAEDDYVVAEPVLKHSPVLTDDDLIRVADSKSPSHATFIAQRTSLSEHVTDAVAHRGDDQTRRELAANPGARFGDVAARLLSAQLSRDESLQRTLAEREDMPKHLLAELIRHATHEVRAQLVEKGRFSELNKIEDAARVAEERLGFDFLFDGCDFDQAERQVTSFMVHGQLDELHLVDAMKDNDLALAISILCRLCDLERSTIMTWVSKKQMEPLVVSARAAEFADSTIQQFLSVGPLATWLSNDVRNIAMLRFETLKVETAQRIVSYWNTDG
ncbi:DUF2336 domain-containing protein [Coralliovum pocilloporae]|uniref:DUF2336 domain-containing protein n=1 Tax=Coralliovum pocilloporae TaxID=3066369 RepID=UPI0033072E4B